jgi:serine/threonine protein kinase
MLGEGGFATVKRAKHRKTGQIVAVKDIDRTKLQEQGKSSLKDEIAALKLLRGGPHIVRLYDVFEEKTHTFIVMEVMKGGELLQRIVDKEVYTEREARELCKILFSAVDYMHKKSIAHR